MTTSSPYRQEMYSPFEALRIMLREQTGQFDVQVLGDFIRMMGGM